MGFFDIGIGSGSVGSGPYVPSFTPIGPNNDGVSGSGAGNGFIPNFNPNGSSSLSNQAVNQLVNLKNQFENTLKTINSYTHILQGLKTSSSNLNSSISANNKSLTSLKQDIQDSSKRLKELVKKQAIENKRFDKKFSFDFNFNPREQQANNKIYEGLFNQGVLRVLDVFLTNPYAIFPKGVIYEYHKPGSLNYNALNAYNPMDGINNQFHTSVLSELNNNTFHRNLAGNAQYNYFVRLNFAKAIKPEFVVFHFLNPLKQKQAWAFLMQNKEYSKGERLKVYNLSFKSSFKALETLKNEIETKTKELKGDNSKLKELESLKTKEQAEIKKLESEIQAKEHELVGLKDKLTSIRNSAKEVITSNAKGLSNNQLEEVLKIIGF
ncbi:hypothetical protein [Helicobacter cetorum]|uniref:hypothetical protein n=1 Tax=Helicobacter cetorum TaxID=138563 RepID=UPI000CF168E7|nr:hypothetical protein [Helicobacter cetorum]